MDKKEMLREKAIRIGLIGINLRRVIYDPEYIRPYLDDDEKEIIFDSSFEEIDRLSAKLIVISGICQNCDGDGTTQGEWICEDCEGNGFLPQGGGYE